MTHEELVEKVARALCEEDGYDPDSLEPGDDPYMNNTPVNDGVNAKGYIGHFFWRRYDRRARAAIRVFNEELSRLTLGEQE